MRARTPRSWRRRPPVCRRARILEVAEWKKMKAEVALMKRQRKKVPGKKNGGKDDKKALSSKIRALISGLRAKHETELRDAGIEVTAEDSGVDAEAYISGEED
ncbi:unnamed protein product [Prorocentrum cordatum]|uniref:Uncharacterized protein n=1 Tax=Prorocentrum cordatum TaxID=2364126 RepID=A0ABN9QAG7_9DINO|nr:unnamed protein product [Polarella glacialis]